MKNILLFTLLICSVLLACNSQSTNENLDIDFAQLAADAESINWAAGTFKELKAEKIALSNLIEDFSKILNYRRDMFPIEISKPTESNQKLAETKAIEIKEAINQLRKALTKIDVQPKNLDAKFRINAKHSGSAYPYGKASLCNQRYAKSMEEIALQDYPLQENVDYDKDFFRMGECLPNLKSLVAFGAEIDDKLLAQLNLHQIKDLQILELSENNISVLPAEIAKLKKLEYLSLRSNNLQNLPVGLENINSLKYINLKNNPIDGDQKSALTQRFKGVTLAF